jgi:hypothetical protein
MQNVTTTNGKRTRANGHTNGTVLHVKPPTVTPQPDVAEIVEIEVRTIEVEIVGKSPLIVNNFGAKGAQQMEDERALTAEEKLSRKKSGKKPIDAAEIERRYQAARCIDSKGRDCVRAQWIKGALISASKYPDVSIASTKLRGAIYVEGDLLPIIYSPLPKTESDERVTYDGKRPGLARDIVRVGKFGAKQPDIRYRPQYDDWSVKFKVTFEPKLISLGAVYHLIRRAGMSVGLGEWRPEGPGGGKGGQFGRFDLSDAAVAVR